MHFLRGFGGALAIALFTLSAAGQDQSVALKSMVDAERAFAAMSVKTNIRDSFLANFADDGVEFNPGPENVKETFSKRPASPNPSPVTLFWEPIFADVSLAGDLGYTTGPYTFTDNVKKAQVSQGFFFSVWKKQPDGKWKVVLDVGTETTSTPANMHALGFKTAPQGKFRANRKIDLESDRRSLLDADKQMSERSQATVLAQAYLDYMDEDARLDYTGMLPLMGKDEIFKYYVKLKASTAWKPIKSDVSSSGDLGYTYGAYESRGLHPLTTAPDPEKGYYAHVWKRDAKGNWKLVMETAKPAPAEKKQ